MTTKFLIKFIENLPQNAKVLDVGCGKGKTIRQILKIRPDVSIYAIDIKNQLADLEEKVNFREGDLTNVKDIFEESFFDAVICQHVIEHLLYPTDLMENIKFVLKNKGKLFLETPNWTRLFYPFLSIYFFNDPTHVRAYTKRAFRVLFKEFSFRIIDLRSISSAKLILKDILLAIGENEK